MAWLKSTVTADSKLTSSDTRRIWAIVGASGNLAEWFDFYVYSFCSLYFAHISSFREHDDSTTTNSRCFCCGIPDAPNRRLAIWPHSR